MRFLVIIVSLNFWRLIMSKKHSNNYNRSYNNNSHNNTHNNTRNNTNNNTTQNNNMEDATTPYNFVPLNNEVVLYNSDNKKEKTYSGKIKVTIKNLTPIFVRNSNQQNDTTQADSKFYAPADKYRIPGSSLRGLIRNMVEIVSFGKFSFFEERFLYFRDFANQPLRSAYSQYNLSSLDSGGRVVYGMKMGKLFKDGRSYKIEDYGTPRRIKNEDLEEIYNKAKKNYDPGIWSFLEFAQVLYVSSTGLNNKVRNWQIPLNNKQRDLYLSQNDIFEYENDRKREKSKKVPHLFKALKNNNYVPVFFIEWSDSLGTKHISIGHTGLFRLPYKFSIGEKIPTKKLNEEIDLSTSIFGDEKQFAGKVYFEDCYLQRRPEQFESLSIMKPLLSPNPTSFQLYLENKKNSNAENLNHYNTINAKIRGYKLYWHRDESYIYNANNSSSENRNIITSITPVKKDNTFSGVIGFKDLTKIQLGALLFILNLPKELALKLGSGKPFNLGSIKITSELDIEQDNYFSDIRKGWFNNQLNTSRDSIDFIKAFENFIIKETKSNFASIWEIDRMKELRTLLNYDKRPKSDKTEYMAVTDRRFRKRYVLPKPTEIVK